jgi:2-oxoglutarate ferredoxin oxidoreductase subunit delta
MRRRGPIEYEIYLICIEKEPCEGCGRCARICPVDVFSLHQDTNDPTKHWPSVVRSENCLNCGGCQGICPGNAISIQEI